MPDETATPQVADAILIPESYKAGETSYDRIGSVCDICEPLLGVDRSKGEAAWIKHTTMFAADGSAYALVSKSFHDTFLHPTTSPRKGRPRFRWQDHTTLKGVRLGTLIDPEDRRDATLVI